MHYVQFFNHAISHDNCRYDSSKGMESLEETWVSRANARQRRGRAGRVMSGVCFHMFTSHRYHFVMQEHQVPGKNTHFVIFSKLSGKDCSVLSFCHLFVFKYDSYIHVHKRTDVISIDVN